MKKFLYLSFLIIPLTANAAQEHGGQPLKPKASVEKIIEHAGEAVKKKTSQPAEHGGAPVLEKPVSEHIGNAFSVAFAHVHAIMAAS